MIENTAYAQVYDYFAHRLPKNKTDRITDLNRLLGINGSFAIFSEYRNGTTALMREVARRKGGIYVDAHGLITGKEVQELEQRIGIGGSLVLLDESTAFFKRLGDDYETAVNYLQQLSERRPIGLRLHPPSYRYKEDLCARGFEAIEIGKIPYEELKAICDTKFGSIEFPFPEKFIQYAHASYNQLGKSVRYIGEAFRLIVEEKRLGVSETEVRKSMEERDDV